MKKAPLEEEEHELRCDIREMVLRRQALSLFQWKRKKELSRRIAVSRQRLDELRRVKSGRS